MIACLRKQADQNRRAPFRQLFMNRTGKPAHMPMPMETRASCRRATAAKLVAIAAKATMAAPMDIAHPTAVTAAMNAVAKMVMNAAMANIAAD